MTSNCSGCCDFSRFSRLFQVEYFIAERLEKTNIKVRWICAVLTYLVLLVSFAAADMSVDPALIGFARVSEMH